MTSEYTELLKELLQQEDHELVVTTLKKFLAGEIRQVPFTHTAI